MRKSPFHVQKILNGEVHDWYRTVLGFTDHLVSDLLCDLGVKPGNRVLDPFCGTGRAVSEAISLGRRGLGFELSPKFAANARRRVQKASQTVGDAQ